jgi:hypothetical protein
MHVIRAKAPTGFAEGQDGTLGVQTHPLHFGLLIFFLFTFHLMINFSFHNSNTPTLHYSSYSDATESMKQPPPPPPPLASEFALCVPPFVSWDWALSSPSASTEVTT